MTPVECEGTLVQIEAAFPLFADKPDLLAVWRGLVLANDCKGKIAHDARLVAAMKTYGIVHILTFNVSDFSRFPGVIVLDPAKVVSATASP